MNVLQAGDYEIKATVDEDGHLTLSVTHSDASQIMDIGEDVAACDTEFAVRLTTHEIEQQHAAKSPYRLADQPF